MRPRSASVLNFFAAALLFSGCSELRTIDADGRCGNGVLEPESGEDCDTYPLGEGTACGERSSDHACLYVCGPSANGARCPEGWGCGLDGACRAPSPDLATATILGEGGTSLGLGDFDGDGRTDLLLHTTAGLHVAFGDPDGRFARSYDFSAASSAFEPSVGDLDGDGLDDVAILQPAGLLLARGRSNRSLAPVAFPSADVGQVMPGLSTYAVRALPPYVRHVTLGLFATPRGVDAVVLEAGMPAGMPSSAGQALMGMPATLADHLAIGEITASGRGDEIAVVGAGGDRVVVLGVACTDTSPRMACEIVPRATIPIEAPFRAAKNGTFLAASSFGRPPDIIVVVRDATSIALAVARADGAGGFSPARVDRALSSALDCTRCPLTGPNVIATADLDGDGITDFVTQDGVFRVASTSPFHAVKQANAQTPWFTAVTADLNGDGRLDLAASRPDALDILLSAGDGLYNTLEGEVAGSPGLLATGDFDGDLALDLAVTTGGVLSVLFGGRTGAPSDRVVVGDFGEIAALTARTGAAGLDRVSSLLVVTRQASGPQQGAGGQPPRELVVDVAGNSARRLVAPLRLTAHGDLLALGHLDGPDDRADVLILGEPGPQQKAWLFAGERLDDAVPAAAELTVDAACSEGTFHAILTHEVHEAGRTGALAVMKETPSEGPDVGRHALELWSVADGHLVCTKLGEATNLGAPVRLELGDLDGDGFPDAIVTFDSNRVIADPQMRTQPAGLAVWWGRAGTERFEAAPTELPMPAAASLAMLAAMDVDGDARDELVFVDATGMGMAELGATRRDLVVAPERTPLAVAAEAVRLLAPIDPDGSGLLGVAVGTGEDLLVFPRRPCTAKRLADGQCTRRALP